MSSAEPGEGQPTIKELGWLAGSLAKNPLTSFQEVFGDIVAGVDRRDFLQGYLDGFTVFFAKNSLVVPINTYLDDIFTTQAGLAGLTKGLEREKPVNGQATGEEEAWEYTHRLFTSKLYGDGYFMGFMASLARDYGFSANPHEVPSTPSQFDLFFNGLNAQPLTLPSWVITEKWASERDQQLGILVETLPYVGGLKLWLFHQEINVDIAYKIKHPESLKGFMVALNGEPIPQGLIENSPQWVGYQLGKAEFLRKINSS